MSQDWSFVEEQATDALDEIVQGQGHDPISASMLPSFQWALIGARFNQRRRQEAWDALERLDPPIRNEQDARLWLSLSLDPPPSFGGALVEPVAAR